MILLRDTLKSERGLTFIEMIISIVILSLVAGVCAQMVAGAFDSWNYSRGKADLLNTARLAMERMVEGVRTTSWVLHPLMITDPKDPGFPGSSYYPRDILAVSGMIDNDADLLPDEDPGSDLYGNLVSGLMGIDDNYDGTVDNGNGDQDDDEDGTRNEDPVDGIDNDGDGRVDEDPDTAFYSSTEDDDGDGAQGEDVFDPVIYYLSGTDLRERHDQYTVTTQDNVIAENVAAFQVLRRMENGNTLIDIYLKLDNGSDSVELSTTAQARLMFKP